MGSHFKKTKNLNIKIKNYLNNQIVKNNAK